MRSVNGMFLVRRVSKRMIGSINSGLFCRKGTRLSPPSPFRLEVNAPGKLLVESDDEIVSNVGRRLVSVSRPVHSQLLIRYFTSGLLLFTNVGRVTNVLTKR